MGRFSDLPLEILTMIFHLLDVIHYRVYWKSVTKFPDLLLHYTEERIFELHCRCRGSTVVDLSLFQASKVCRLWRTVILRNTGVPSQCYQIGSRHLSHVDGWVQEAMLVRAKPYLRFKPRYKALLGSME